MPYSLRAPSVSPSPTPVPAREGPRAAPRARRFDVASLVRRLTYFWLVWSALLLIHESGHALVARRQGLAVHRLTVGAGPVLWRGQRGATEVVLRLVPVVGATDIGTPRAIARENAATERAPQGRWRVWGGQVATLAGGILATLALAIGVAAVVATSERLTRRRWVWGRAVVADALVLTVFNFLPVPPLDGGRALLGAVDAWRGAPLSGHALFWLQAGGLALAVVPMSLWTRWTARIDAVSMRWGAPRPRE